MGKLQLWALGAAAIATWYAAPAHADDFSTGVRVRAWGGVVGRYVLTDNENFDTASAGTVALQVNGSAAAIGASVEYKPIKWVGIEGAVAYMDAPVAFASSNDPGVEQRTTFSVVPLYLGVNFHPVHLKHLDVWFGPALSYEMHPEDLDFRLHNGATFHYESKNAFSLEGFSVGVDIPFDDRVALNLGFRWQDADADPDGHLTYDPTFITIGATAKL